MFIVLGHLVYMFLSRAQDTGGVGVRPSLLPMAPQAWMQEVPLTLWPEVTNASFYFSKAPLTPPVLTSEQPPGGGPGNWFHPTLIFSGVKGKVINIFYL